MMLPSVCSDLGVRKLEESENKINSVTLRRLLDR